MEIKNREIIGLLNTLTSFGDRKLPQRISFAIMKNISALTKEYTIYEKAIKKLFEQYDSQMLKDEKGNIIYDSDGLPKLHVKDNGFRDDVNDLLDIPVDVELYTIDENVFDYEDKDGRYDPMSPTQILVLQSILCEHK